MDLAAIFADSSCSLLAHSGVDIPRKSYAEQLKDSDTALVSTYVTFRNGLFLSSAASIALSLGCSALYYVRTMTIWQVMPIRIALLHLLKQ